VLAPVPGLAVATAALTANSIDAVAAATNARRWGLFPKNSLRLSIALIDLSFLVDETGIVTHVRCDELISAITQFAQFRRNTTEPRSWGAFLFASVVRAHSAGLRCAPLGLTIRLSPHV
jgi:hypothetical protein